MFGANKNPPPNSTQGNGNNPGQNSSANVTKPPATTEPVTTVRVLRTLPVDGVIYKADQLVSFTAETLAGLPKAAVDSDEAAVTMRTEEGAKVIVHGATTEKAQPEKPADGEGEIVE